MRHCPPRMVLGRGLREPDVSRIAGKLAALECAHDRIAIGQLAARGVDQIGTALEALERLVVDHVLGLRIERYVERDDVADAVHLLAAVVPGEAQFRLHLGRQAVAVGIMEEIGRAHVWTPVTNAHLVCRLLLDTKTLTSFYPTTCSFSASCATQAQVL